MDLKSSGKSKFKSTVRLFSTNSLGFQGVLMVRRIDVGSSILVKLKQRIVAKLRLHFKMNLEPRFFPALNFQLFVLIVGRSSINWKLQQALKKLPNPLRFPKLSDELKQFEELRETLRNKSLCSATGVTLDCLLCKTSLLTPCDDENFVGLL